MRLQVFLSRSRICSRRKALNLVKEGYVSVNNNVIREPSYDVDPGTDEVYFNDRKVELKKNSYIIVNKPRGFVTTLMDRHAEKTVLSLLPAGYRHLYPVGRLDKDSEGLLLFTNDGDLAFRLIHPSFKVNKVYFVDVRGNVKHSDVLRLQKGVFIEGRKTHPACVKIIYSKGGASGLEITIHEGRKRQIRLMLLSLGYRVIRLRRVKYGSLELGKLKPGQWRLLNNQEISSLYKGCGLS